MLIHDLKMNTCYVYNILRIGWEYDQNLFLESWKTILIKFKNIWDDALFVLDCLSMEFVITNSPELLSFI